MFAVQSHERSPGSRRSSRSFTPGRRRSSRSFTRSPGSRRSSRSFTPGSRQSSRSGSTNLDVVKSLMSGSYWCDSPVITVNVRAVLISAHHVAPSRVLISAHHVVTSRPAGHALGPGSARRASARVWFTDLLLPASQVVYMNPPFKSVEILLKSRCEIKKLIP